MAINLVNDFRTKGRIYGENGGYFVSGGDGVAINTAGRILSSGVDLTTVFSGALQSSQNLTFGTNLSATNPTYNPGVAVTVRVTDTPIFTKVDVTSAFFGNLSGNAISATRWATPRTISFSNGDVNGSFVLDGTANVTTTLSFSAGSVSAIRWSDAYNRIVANSANWNTAYNSVNTNSTNWNSVYSHVNVTSANWSSVYSQVNTNSANWNTAYNSINTNSTNWNSVYSHVNVTSANWSSVYSQVNSKSANWDSNYSSYNAASGNIVNGITGPATQGRINFTRLNGTNVDVDINNLGTGGSPQFTNITITNNATVQGNLSVQGSLTFLDTGITTTSALSVFNAGTGPALYVEQSGNNAIARFVDKEGGEIVFNDTGNVSIGTTTSTQRLNVGGNILATNATFSGMPVGTNERSMVLSGTGGQLVTRLVNTKVFDTAVSLLDGSSLTTNFIPRASDSDTLVNSGLLDSGAILSAARPIVTPEVRLFQSDTFNTKRDLFTGIINISGNNVVTWAKADMRSVKFFVTLVSGSQTTTFEIIGTCDASTTPTQIKGTVYGIIDTTTTTHLVDADLSFDSTNLILSISSTNNNTTALIEGVAMFQPSA